MILSMKDDIESITKDRFEAYCRVQEGGHYNMFMDAADAAAEADLPLAAYCAILLNYEALKKKFS